MVEGARILNHNQPGNQNRTSSLSSNTLHSQACLSYYLPVMKSSRLVVVAITTSLLWFGLAASISAQQPPIAPTPKPDHEKDLLYQAFSEGQRSINPVEQKLAYPAAKAFLLRFGAITTVTRRRCNGLLMSTSAECAIKKSSERTVRSTT